MESKKKQLIVDERGRKMKMGVEGGRERKRDKEI